MALTGYVDEISRSVIQGWVIDSERPDETVSVSIIVNGVHRGVCLATYDRTDVVSPNGERVVGKCGFCLVFDPPLSQFIEQRVEVVETWSAELLPNGSRVLPRPRPLPGGEAGRAPILLTSTGRSGTTLLMSEFAGHPDIVVAGQSPYEIKQIAYHAAAFRALAADGDRELSTSPETMLAPRMCHDIGSNPYNIPGLLKESGAEAALLDFYQTAVPSGYATLFRTFILEFYRRHAAAQGKQTALYFCEKGDTFDLVARGARLFFDTVKDIVIVRDPRDLLCSSIAFWKHRPDAAMAMLIESIPRLARIIRDAGPDTIVIRYEDLVRVPVATRRTLADFLDLDLLSHRMAEAGAIPDSHRTSTDPAASVGRWRHELTPEQVDTCEAVFGAYMRRFDYEPGHRSRSAARDGTKEAKQLVAAEGVAAVSAFVEANITDGRDGTRCQQVLELTFGRDGTGEAFTLDGWSAPERGFVWSCEKQSHVRLPAIRRDGTYVLHVIGAPFTYGDALPAQRVAVLLNGHLVGKAKVRDICALAVPVPVEVVGSGEIITLTLRLPDAAQPSAIRGGDDHRTLGFSLHRIALFRTETDAPAAGPVLARPAVDQTDRPAAADQPFDPFDPRHAERCRATGDRMHTSINAILREALDEPELECRSRTVLRKLPGFNSLTFVRLILALEAKFGVELHEDEVDAIETMGDILRLLRAKVPGAA